MRLAVSQTLRSGAVVLLGCLATSTAFAQINPNQHNNPAAPPPPTQNVLVVNGSGQPVPTAPQGTTNVAGTVNVGNTPNVNVTNTPNVNVANTPTVNLAAGTATGVGNFVNLQSFIGGSAGNTLIGPNAPTTWGISAQNAGTLFSSN